MAVPERSDKAIDLPPGFRFYPTDEEIISHYLFPKVVDCSFTARAMGEVDLNRSEPWELPAKAKMGETDFYFFCRRDRKYPTGARTNRATGAGYWKATGKDKDIHAAGSLNILVGRKKTLVFYKGRAPRGVKTNWVMHEYRLEGKASYWKLPKSAKDDWVVCRVLHKTTGLKREYPEADAWSNDDDSNRNNGDIDPDGGLADHTRNKNVSQNVAVLETNHLPIDIYPSQSILLQYSQLLQAPLLDQSAPPLNESPRGGMNAAIGEETAFEPKCLMERYLRQSQTRMVPPPGMDHGFQNQ